MVLDCLKLAISPFLFLWVALTKPNVDFRLLTEWVPFLRRHIRYYNEIVHLDHDDLQKLATFSHGKTNLKPLNSIILLDNCQTDISYLIGPPNLNGIPFVNFQKLPMLSPSGGTSAYLTQNSVKMLLFELDPVTSKYKIFFTSAVKPGITVRGDPRNNDFPVHYQVDFIRNSNGDKVPYNDPSMNFLEILPGESIYTHYPHLDHSIIHPDTENRLQVPVQKPFKLIHQIVLDKLTNTIVYPSEEYRNSNSIIIPLFWEINLHIFV